MDEFQRVHSEGAPRLLPLHTVGARTVSLRAINPMMYLPDGDRYLVFASKAGSDRNPDWYHNLLAHPDTQIEVGDRVLDVHASELHGQERDQRFQDQASLHPGFAGYQDKTLRVIPVIALTPTP